MSDPGPSVPRDRHAGSLLGRQVAGYEAQAPDAGVGSPWSRGSHTPALSGPEVRAFSSLLARVSERLAVYEEQAHQDVRYAEELQAAAEDLLGRLEREERTGSPFEPLSVQDLGAD